MDNEEKIIELLTEIRDSLKKPEPKKRGKKFFKPWTCDVVAYCEERKNNVDSSAFMAHYDSNGWMVGKNKMKDWKACVRTWEKRNGANNGNQQQTSKPSLAERATQARKDYEQSVDGELVGKNGPPVRT